MNDKIKLFNELAIKYAQESLNDIAIVNKSGIMYNYNDLYTEKFAELIVRECVNWIDGSPTTEEGTLILSKSFIIANLKQHFGVEE